jgi:hypothetical protein
LANIGLSPAARADVLDFIIENQDRLRELSLRMALKIGAIRRRSETNWRKVARVTTCRQI